MSADQMLPLPASRHALALLRFPDPRTDWVVVTVATLSEPIHDLGDRLRDLQQAVPICGARLQSETWVAGSAPLVELVRGEPLDCPPLDRPFHLASESPLRLVVGAEGRRLAVIGHHAAFDGLALVAILRSLVCGTMPEPVDSPPPGPAGSPLPLLHRLARPAARLHATPGHWPSDTYATTSVAFTGRGVTGQLSAAAVDAAVAHNARRGQRLGRVGLTIAVGGPMGVGNVASYRRIDVRPDAPVADLVAQALASNVEPGEQVRAPRLILRGLGPVVERFSDTLLISNLGRHDVPGVERLDFFPVARGRSAVSVASASVAGGETSVTVRARDLSPADARRFLNDLATRFRPSPVRIEGSAQRG
jgi:hypothetical protein